MVLPEWELIVHNDEMSVWQNDVGDGLSLTLAPHPPALGAPLDDLNALRRFVRTEAAEAEAGIVEVDVIDLDTLPAVRFIVKKPQQPSGMTYEGTLLLPRRDFSFTIRVLCRETGVTGRRDAAVFLRLAAEHDVPEDTPDGWFSDPYDPLFEGRTLRNLSDDPEWDDLFPDHPLSRCRAHLQMLEERISLKEEVRVAPAFTGPS